MQGARVSDQVARVLFIVCAVLIVLIMVGVFYIIGSQAFTVFSVVTPGKFFFGNFWDPTGAGDPGGNSNPSFGASGLIVGSIIITLLSVIIAAPLAIGLALLFTEASPRWLTRILQPLIEIFTGMPSVVIGVLGLIVLVPLLQKLSAPLTGNSAVGGFGWAAATLVLVIMILPTIISVSIDALRAVPGSVREASLSLGSTSWQTMKNAVIPAAAPGLGTAIVLGMARAIGETLAVALVLGGSQAPGKIFSWQAFFGPNVNITQQIAQDFGETLGTARAAYWTLAFVLLIISFIFICISRYLTTRSVYR